MKNAATCKNCKTENPFYELNCLNCGSILRSRVANIDLWNSAWQIIESPAKALTNIIWSEHKNFSLALIILFSLKLFLNLAFVSGLVDKSLSESSNIYLQLAITLGLDIILFLLFSYVLKLILHLNGIHTRVKDNLSILAYSSIPLILSMLILFPIEYALFGRHWIIFNPSPFFFKEGAAYALSVIEGIFALWNITIVFIGVKIQSRNTLFSIVFSLLFLTVFYGAGLLLTVFLISAI